jgi:RNA recognition motif. (a.k.a. RRM, RBD, or RNP domain)
MPDGGGAGDKPRTLWIGDLGYWMDETFLYNLFAATGTVTSVKIIRSKTTNVSEGYGFIEFTSHEAAAQVRACPCCFALLPMPLVFTVEQIGSASAAHADLVSRWRCLPCRYSTPTTGAPSRARTRYSGSTGRRLAWARAAQRVKHPHTSSMPCVL